VQFSGLGLDISTKKAFGKGIKPPNKNKPFFALQFKPNQTFVLYTYKF